MKKYIHLPIYLLILIIHTSCVSTTIISSWKEQNKQIEIGKLHKVLVVALFKDETNRRKAEDQMVIYLKGKGIVSYNYLDDNISAKNEEAIRDKIKTDGFDGAITMRLIDVDKEKMQREGISLGQVQTTNPEGVNKLTEEVTKVVYKKMVSEGFINK